MTKALRDGWRWFRIFVAMVSFAVLVLAAVGWAGSDKQAIRLHGLLNDDACFLVASKQGCVTFYGFRSHADGWWKWDVLSYPVDDELTFPLGEVSQYTNGSGFGWIDNVSYFVMRPIQRLPDGREVMVWGAATATLSGHGIVVPYWFVAACAALLLTGSLLAVGLCDRNGNDRMAGVSLPPATSHP